MFYLLVCRKNAQQVDAAIKLWKKSGEQSRTLYDIGEKWISVEKERGLFFDVIKRGEVVACAAIRRAVNSLMESVPPTLNAEEYIADYMKQGPPVNMSFYNALYSIDHLFRGIAHYSGMVSDIEMESPVLFTDVCNIKENAWLVPVGINF